MLHGQECEYNDLLTKIVYWFELFLKTFFIHCGIIAQNLVSLPFELYIAVG